MPPKNKKEQEEQAARLAEEQRLKEEEEARLAIERQKYAAQTLDTGLLLPASNQLILDLYSQPLTFVTQKIQQAVKESCPNLNDDPIFKKVILKELVYYLSEGAKLFQAQKLSQVTGNQDKLLKVRVLAAISWKVITHEHKCLGGQGKSRADDQRIFREQLSLHVQKGEGKMKVFCPQQIQSVMSCISAGYFCHYLLLQNYRNFQKRQSQLEQHIYLSTPVIFRNNKDTAWTDLSQNAKKEEVAEQQKPASQ